MIKFGVSTFVWYSPFMTNCFGLLEKVANMGYDIIEIAVEDKDLIDWKSLKKIADYGTFGCYLILAKKIIVALGARVIL